MTIYARALITGATSGIGAAFAAQLPAPTSLLLTGRDRWRLEEMRERLDRPGREVAILEADLSSAADRERLAARAEQFAIDLLINNAGSAAFGPVLENEPAAESTTAEVNTVAVVDLTCRLLPSMIDRARDSRRRAGLINVSSTLAFQPTPFLATYAASKAFVLIYTQALAAELRREPIDVLTLCPGPTRTAFGRRAGFSLGNLPGSDEPAVVARQALSALGRRNVRIMGPVARSLLGPGLAAQSLATHTMGALMRVVGRAL